MFHQNLAFDCTLKTSQHIFLVLHIARLFCALLSDGDECTLSANVLMQLVLQIDEAVVRILGEGDIAQNGRYRKRSNLSSCLRDDQLLRLGPLADWADLSETGEFYPKSNDK